MRLCLSYFPNDYPSWLGGTRLLRPAYELLCRASNYKRNPRDPDYMKALVAEMLGSDFQWIDVKSLRHEFLTKSREIILLWPDGNGYGWFGVERRVFALKDKDCRVMVLNGRRRYFRLSPGLWPAYLLRRCLERFWVGELVFMAFFVLVSPVIAGLDLRRGRKG